MQAHSGKRLFSNFRRKLAFVAIQKRSGKETVIKWWQLGKTLAFNCFVFLQWSCIMPGDISVLVSLWAGTSSRESCVRLLMGERWGGCPDTSVRCFGSVFWATVTGFSCWHRGICELQLPGRILGTAPKPPTGSEQVLCSESEAGWEDAAFKACMQDGEGDLCEEDISSVRLRAWRDPLLPTLGESAGQLLVLVQSQEKGDCCLSPLLPWASSSF